VSYILQSSVETIFTGDAIFINGIFSKWWGAGVIICLERGADLHMAQLMPLPLTVSCFSEIQIGFTFLVPAHLGSPGKRAVKRVLMHICKFASESCHERIVKIKLHL